MRRTIVLALFIAFPLFAADGGCPAKWGYETANGPDRWGQMDEKWAPCDIGREQSPIDITTAVRKPELPAPKFRYDAIPLVVQNTSHELKVSVAAGTVTLGTTTATLRQFHFHVPSEHTVNGKHAAAELHLVHETKDKRLVVVGILIEAGAANDALQHILDLRPAAACSSRKTDASFNPLTLLPAGAHDYYTYRGSLTTPACKEDVTWIVLRQPITASEAQLEQLRVEHENARPTQPLGPRTVARNF